MRSGSKLMHSGVFKGVDMERCPPPCGRRLIFSACSNLYRENNGLLRVEFKGKFLAIAATDTLNSITNLILTSLVPKIVLSL